MRSFHFYVANLKMNKSFRAILFVILISIKVVLEVHADPEVPCFFIFGDSLSDAGNNNGLNTKAKANYKPYGVDFLHHLPTGRFTNGRTIVDVIAEHLGFTEYIQPFSSAKGRQILLGVNYASGAAGIRPETSQHLGGRVSLKQQVENHKAIITKLDPLLKGSARAHLQSCLYTINMGNNDYINNYFLSKLYPTAQRYNPNQYAAALVDQYKKNIKTLYVNGARKIALFALGPVGCTLAAIAEHQPKTICVDSMNNAVSLFNNRLKKLVKKLNKQHGGAKFTFINNQAINIGPAQGFTVLNETCCRVNEIYQCIKSKTPCMNRNSYLFWDGFHPTEAVNRIMGEIAYKATDPLDVYPFNISQLVKA